MAILKGILQIEGSLTNISFYKNKRGVTIVRKKGGPSKEKIKNAPSFEKVRKTNAEFGKASKAGRTIRTLSFPADRFTGDGTLNERLVQKLMAVMRADEKHEKGERLISCGNLKLLEGLEWDPNMLLEDALKTDIAGDMDPESGNMHVITASFDSKQDLVIAEGATHFRLFAQGWGWHPEASTRYRSLVHTDYLQIDKGYIDTVTLKLAVPANEYPILMLGFGIAYYAENEKEHEQVRGGAFQLMKVVRTGVAVE